MFKIVTVVVFVLKNDAIWTVRLDESKIWFWWILDLKFRVCLPKPRLIISACVAEGVLYLVMFQFLTSECCACSLGKTGQPTTEGPFCCLSSHRNRRHFFYKFHFNHTKYWYDGDRSAPISGHSVTLRLLLGVVIFLALPRVYVQTLSGTQLCVPGRNFLTRYCSDGCSARYWLVLWDHCVLTPPLARNVFSVLRHVHCFQ